MTNITLEPTVRRTGLGVTVVAALACGPFVATPGVAATPSCTATTAQAAAPAGMTMGPINDLNPDLPPVPTGALLLLAQSGTPSYCLVTGSIVMNPGTGKTANFAAESRRFPLR